MATAEEYAKWIVANPDKKGTPEFDTVSKAYQAAKATSAAPATPAGTGAPPTIDDIPGQAGRPPPAAPAEQPTPGFMDVMTSGPEAARTMIQNPLAAGVGQVQSVLEDVGAQVMGKPHTDPQARAAELTQRYSHQPTNPVVQQGMSAAGSLMDNDAVRSLQGLGPGGGILGEAGIVGPAAAGARRGTDIAAGAGAKAGGAVTRGMDLVSGKPAARATESLKTGATGSAQQAADLLDKQAKALEQARAPSLAPAAKDTAGVQMKVADKLKAQSAAIDQHMESLKGMHVSDEDVGALIQSKGTAHIDTLKQARDAEAIKGLKDPAFADAPAREAKGDYVSTNPKSKPFIERAAATLRKAIADTPVEVPGLEKPLAALESGTLTLEQAEYLRRMAGSALEREKLGFAALNAKRLGDLASDMRQAMTAYDSRVGKYLDRYKAHSEGIERAEGGRAGAAATDVLVGEGSDAVRNQKGATATRNYMDGSRQSAQKMLELTGGKSDDLVAAVSGNLVGKMQDMSAKAARDFVRKNKGLLEVFDEAKPLVDQIVKNKERSEQLGNMITKSSERTGKNLDAADAAKKGLRDQAPEAKQGADKLRKSLLEMQAADSPKAVTKVSKDILETLKANGRVTDEQYVQGLREIERVDQMNASVADTKRLIKHALTTVGVGALGYEGLRHTGVLP